MLKLDKVCRKLGSFRLTDITLDIPAGTYYVLLGRSGAGKTQLLELIAGLTRTDSGEIWLDGINITQESIQKRRIGLVFQDYAIFPNMSVFANIAYSLTSGRYDRTAVKERVMSVARELNIMHLLDRDTRHLSGGEKQRVALARTLITSPKLLLLDEPMASVDASLKDDIRRLLRRLNRQGLTIIHVTHDYREAVSLASRVGVMHNGKIIQEGTPDKVFRKPVNRFVARYAGIRNFFRVRFTENNGEYMAVSNKNITFSLSEDYFLDEGMIILRSDDIEISTVPPPAVKKNTFRGIVTEILPTESGYELTVDAGEVFYVDISADMYKNHPVTEQSEVWLNFAPEALVVLQGTG